MSSKLVRNISNEIFNIARKTGIEPFKLFYQFYLRELACAMTRIDKSIIIYGGFATAIHAGQYNRIIGDLDISFKGSRKDLQDFAREITDYEKSPVKFEGFVGSTIKCSKNCYNLNFKTQFNGYKKVIMADAGLYKFDEGQYEVKKMPKIISCDNLFSVRTVSQDEHIVSKVKAMFSFALLKGKLRAQDVYDLMFMLDRCKSDVKALRQKVHEKIKQDEATRGKFCHNRIEMIVDKIGCGDLKQIVPLTQKAMSNQQILKNAKIVLGKFV